MVLLSQCQKLVRIVLTVAVVLLSECQEVAGIALTFAVALLSQCQELAGIVLFDDPLVSVSRTDMDCVDCCSGPLVSMSSRGTDGGTGGRGRV